MNRLRLPPTRAILLLLLLTGGLYGCAHLLRHSAYMGVTVDPDRLHRIETLDLDAMSAAPQADEEQPSPLEAPAEVSLSIEQCRAAALQNNLDLKVQLLSPAIARQSVHEELARFEALFLANASRAWSDTPTSTTLSGSQGETFSGDAGLQFPLITGGSVALDVPVSRTETDNAFATLNPSYSADFAVSISQPLLRGAGPRANTHAIRVAHYQSQIIDAQTKLEVIRVIAAVDRVYWRLYAARKQLEVRKQQYDLAVAQLERARRQVEAGTVSEVEIIRAEAGVAEQLEAIILADNAVRDRQRDLKRVIQKSDLPMSGPTTVVPVTEPNPLHYQLDADRLVAAAVDSRMEMLELELQLATDASSISYQRNQLLPLVTLDYTYNVNGLGPTAADAFDLMLENRFIDHRVGLSVQVPLGNEAAKAQLRRAVYERLQRLATRSQREAQIEQETLSAIDQLEANWQRIAASGRAAVLAARNLAAEQRQFEIGLRTSTDVLDAQTRLADAQSAEVLALTEYEIAQVDIAVATGTLLGAADVRWAPTEPVDNVR